MNTSPLFEMMRKHQEAQAVRLGLPINRHFSDDELVDSMSALAEAEHDLALEMYGTDPRDESGCPLSGPEVATLHELNRKLLSFRVTVTLPAQVEQINVLATDACMAIVKAFEIMFPDFEDDKPQAFKIKVEPVKLASLRRAA